MNIEDFTPEQIERAKACKTSEELLALAKQEGVEFTDKQLEQITGGESWGLLEPLKAGCCPNCYGNEILLTVVDGKSALKCSNCGTVFGVEQ